MSKTESPPQVYARINAVQAALAKEGITKNRTNSAQGYKFRGIDDVYNAISGLLADSGLSILPRYTERTFVERETKNGGTLTFTVVRGEFDFVAAEDGSKHTVVTYGEAQDSGDKSTNKAMSAAFKYAIMQAFAIPTEGDNDADASTPEESKRRTNSKAGAAGTTSASASGTPSGAKSPDAALAAEPSPQRKLLQAELAKFDKQARVVEGKLIVAMGLNVETQTLADIPEDKLPEALTKVLAFKARVDAAAKGKSAGAAKQESNGKPKLADGLPV